MDLTITSEAATHLPQDVTQFILTANDGSNQFSSAAGCCMIGERFLITPIEEIIAPFTLEIPSNLFTFYTSEYDTMFLSGHLELFVHPTSGTLVLKNESGYLDNNVLLLKPESVN
jgi:uncharacterized protein YqkB